ncbi:hypothetical protein [Vibrio parahaemolyticus]|uniref:hypothetical protein n=1 Tax=Vibrio parahaemolyticus TaxID=670 RepID=UPI00301CC12C
MSIRNWIPCHAIEYKGHGHEGMTDSAIHISGGFLAGMETLCGNCDTLMPMKRVDKKVTCEACEEIYKSIQANKNIKFA